MSEEEREITVAGLGDLHASEDTDRGLRELFREISERADVLALCGDLTNLGTPGEARALARDLESCRVPVVAVLGNHDHECGQVEEVEHILKDAGIRFLEDKVCRIHGVGFVGVKGFAGGFERRMLGPFGEPAIKAFVAEAETEAMRLERSLCALDAERVVVVLHYAPIAATVAGEPAEIFPFLGSSRLGDTIDRFKVSLVLHGHAHHGTYAGKTPKGVPVYNCAATVPKDGGRPYALLKV